MKRLGIKGKIRGVEEHYLKYRGTAIADKVPDFQILIDARKGRDKLW